MPSLLALFGPKRGVRVEIEGGVVVVGRSSGADIQLIDEKVSREHCRFTVKGSGEAPDGARTRGNADAVEVEDLKSHNGTYVNGERLDAPRVLKGGDEIAVGDSLFVLDGEVDAAAARFGDATLIVAPPPAGGGTGVTATPAPHSAEAPEVHAIAELAALLSAAPDIERAARAVLGSIEKSLKPDRAFVLLWDATRKVVTPLVGKSDGSAVSISRTVLEAAAAARKPVVVDDAVEDRQLKDAKSVVRHRLHSVLVAPIVTGGPVPGGGQSEAKVRGFLHADRHTKGAYGAGDAALLHAFASLVAVHGLFGAAGTHRASATTPPPRTGSHGLTATTTGVTAIAERPAGDSPAMHEALRIAESAAPVTSTVLITGESGTGKEEVARFLHGSSPRGGRAFVAVNCGAIPESLAESELFGHEKGAFTGAIGSREGKVEAADGGTLFLDEVGELPASIQVKLLRVLQERAFYRVGSTVPRRVDLRVVAATHRDLEADVKSGRFREDLFYRLNVLRIHLPPMRDRGEDLEPLAQALLERLSVTLGKRNPGISKDAMAALGRHRWPGNARELGNVLERMMVLRQGPADQALSSADVAAALGAGPGAAAKGGAAGDDAAGEGTTLAEKIAALERTEVEAALRKARGVKTRAAEMLGISRPTLDKKIADLGIDLWDEKQGGQGHGAKTGEPG